MTDLQVSLMGTFLRRAMELDEPSRSKQRLERVHPRKQNAPPQSLQSERRLSDPSKGQSLGKAL